MEEQEDTQALTGPIAVPAKAATTGQLGGLHGVIAEYLTQAIATGKAPPALVNAGIAFLKNNSITASAETNEALSGLASLLARKKGGQLTKRSMDEAAEHLNNLYGQGDALQ